MRPRRALFVALLVTACGGISCDREDLEITKAPPPSSEILDVSFEALYPVFLQRKSMSQGDKASQWRKYAGHWVRWEGVIQSFTDHGITLKQLLQTVTFDVSLTTGGEAAKKIKGRFALGDRVRYVGRLETYDDIFHTLYLTQGAVIVKVPHGDLGVAADLAHPTPDL